MAVVKLLAETLPSLAGASAERDGRWRLNAGSEMVVVIPGINEDKKGEAQPVRLVLDLRTFKFKNPRITALNEHQGEVVLGFWDSSSVDPAAGFDADLHITTPKDAVEAGALEDCVRLKAHVRAGVPIQASVGAEAQPGKGRWETVKAGETVTLNGRTYAGAGETPLVVLYDGQAYETSLVTFGADSQTGRVAATIAKPPVTTKESSMSDLLDDLLGEFPNEKHHGLIARQVRAKATAPTIRTAVHAAMDAEASDKDKEIEKLKASVATLSAQLAAYANGGKADDAQDVDASELEPDTMIGEGSNELEPEPVVKAHRVNNQSTPRRAQGSSQGIRHAEGSGNGQPRVEASADERKKVQARAGIQTMSAAMKHLQKVEGSKLVGWALREEARREFPNAADG